ncbi:regulator of G-protein signaling 7-binding protein isoform X2 [Prorops nasuta]|uniref:regulator of G-protein signaling 7-binding protein isoform X2 n=1 Tax=Prorops nasuta TaxID=863751 RepID=UPI0034CF9A4A
MTDSPTPSTSKCHDEKIEKTEKAVLLQIQDINCQVAQFRDLLINIGQPRDCPELRERIRKLRRNCVDACKHASQSVLPHVQSAMDVGIPVDSPNLVLLFFVTQLFLRELYKSKNLVRIIPMDMSGYYESKAGPSNIGTVISQILLCKQITPDFNEEELCSIRKDSEEISALIAELQEFMPQSEAETEKCVALQEAGSRLNKSNGGRKIYRWNTNRSRPFSYFRGGFKFFCCTARANYV